MDKSIVEDVIKLDTERLVQVELDGIFESNKLSKDIGEMMKNGENRKPLS
jgi:seryl-tRNA synthetase